MVAPTNAKDSAASSSTDDGVTNDYSLRSKGKQPLQPSLEPEGEEDEETKSTGTEVDTAALHEEVDRLTLDNNSPDSFTPGQMNQLRHILGGITSQLSTQLQSQLQQMLQARLPVQNVAPEQAAQTLTSVLSSQGIPYDASTWKPMPGYETGLKAIQDDRGQLLVTCVHRYVRDIEMQYQQALDRNQLDFIRKFMVLFPLSSIITILSLCQCQAKCRL